MTEKEKETEGRERAADERETTGEALDAQLDAEDRRQTEAATDAAQATVPKIGKGQVGSGKPLH